MSMKWVTIPEFAARSPETLYHPELSATETAPHDPALQNLHVLARQVVTLPSFASAILRITADDCFKLYVNETFCGVGPAPAYPSKYYYQELDITSYLKEGKNVLATHLYYQGLVNRVWNSGDFRFGMAVQLFLDGKEFPLSAEEWRYHRSLAYSGTTTGYETQFLENFDSRKHPEHWRRLAFDDSQWPFLVPYTTANYTLERQKSHPLTCYTVKPPQVTQIAPGHFFFDMEQEVTGAICLVAEGKAGKKVRILAGEELLEENKVRYDMRCNCRYEEFWTLDDGISTLEPYDYKGFRYGEIICEDGVTLQDISVFIRHYPLQEERSQLFANTPYLEDIFTLCKNSVKYGVQDGYLDCPTREKGQYLGDALVTAQAQVWLSGETALMRKSIEQFAHTTFISSGIMAVAPGNFMQEIADYSLMFPEILLNYYNFTGDMEFLKTYYPTAKGARDYFLAYQRADGLLEEVSEKWNLVDWPENLRDDYDFPLTMPIGPGCHNVINALFLGCTKTVSRIEALLGLSESLAWEPVQQAFLDTFYSPEKQLFLDSETSSHAALHSNVYPLYFGFVPTQAEDSVVEFLLEKGLRCGVFIAYFVLKALAKQGKQEEVLTLITKDGNSSWVTMLKEGATTCFEAWGKEQKWNTSLCHPWACAPIMLLIEDFAGIHLNPTAENGYDWNPAPPKALGDFSLTVPLRGNLITIARKGESLTHTLEQMK